MRHMREEAQTLQSRFMFSYWHFTANGQIASRASLSVPAVQTPIGNHSPVCFLKVSAHQQQRLSGQSELGLRYGQHKSKREQYDIRQPRCHFWHLTKKTVVEGITTFIERTEWGCFRVATMWIWTGHFFFVCFFCERENLNNKDVWKENVVHCTNAYRHENICGIECNLMTIGVFDFPVCTAFY